MSRCRKPPRTLPHCEDIDSSYSAVADFFFWPQIYISVVVQSLSHILLFATPWTAVCQASLSFTNSQSLLKPMSIESVG